MEIFNSLSFNNTVYRQRTDRVELEITTACNLSCYHCDRSSGQAPSSERMSVEQIAKFIDESLKLEKKWVGFEILGGEPTLHPHLIKIIEILLDYKANFKECNLLLVSNGYGPKVNDVLDELKKSFLVPDQISIKNTKKQKLNQLSFNPYNFAPIDIKHFEKDDFSRGCRIIEDCGLGLTRYGFYCCGAGAAIDRVYGYNIGLKHIAEITQERLETQRKILCRVCGHYIGKNYQYWKNNIISKSWEIAFENYAKNKPQLTLF